MNLVDVVEQLQNSGNLDIIYEGNALKPDNLNIELLDIEKFVKANDVQEVTDPIFFVREGVPSPKGLLSNEIFGITKDERANIFGYIDLGDWFLNPLCYKVWKSMDSRIVSIVYGSKSYIVNDSGDFVEDENGETGIAFLKKNIDKIVIKQTDSRIRREKIEFLKKNKDKMFIKKFIVVPAYYRDANTNNGAIGVGQLNKYYSSLLVSSRSLKETQEYGLTLSGAVKGRIQETLVNTYNCICGTSGAESDGVGLSGKKGTVRNAVMSKTTDYGSRLVLSAPELKVERIEDMMATMTHCSLPLSSAIANFEPFVIFFVKRFFENQFSEGIKVPAIRKKTGKVEYIEVKNAASQFSDDRIMEEIKRFIHGFSNRLAPVEIKTEDGSIFYMVFKSKLMSAEDIKDSNVSGGTSLADRRLTWCDVLFMAATEACKNKHVLITRYPMDSYFNQIPQKINICTTSKTEPIYANGEFYRFYPKIREDMIGKNTSNLFIDTLQICNLHIGGMGADYDGDQVSVKGVYTVEANQELDEKMKSLSFFIDLGGGIIKSSSKEAIQSIFCLTKVLSDDVAKLTPPVFS